MGFAGASVLLLAHLLARRRAATLAEPAIGIMEISQDVYR